MNLYKLHTNNEQLLGYEERLQVPIIAWRHVLYYIQNFTGQDNKELIKKTEHLQDAILKDPEFAYKYALRVIQGRWPAAEEIIATDYETIFDYSYDILRGRWRAVEDIMRTDDSWWIMYWNDIVSVFGEDSGI